MQWLIPVLWSASIPVVLFVVLRRQSANEARRKEAWRAFAESRGFRWIDASGPWYRRQPMAVEGSLDGVALRLDTFVVRHGKSSTTYTRVGARLDRPVRSEIEVHRRSFLTPLAALFGRVSIPSAHMAFDEAMVLRSESRELARAVVDETVRTSLLAIPRRLRLVVEGEVAELRWRGSERDPAVLESATRTVAALARACARES